MEQTFVHYGFIVFSIEPIVAAYFRDYGVESFPWLGLKCFRVTQPLRKAGENLK
eukprot:SAG11_NODE_5064_length_1675_cov_18.774112_2_plen_53_part_01